MHKKKNYVHSKAHLLRTMTDLSSHAAKKQYTKQMQMTGVLCIFKIKLLSELSVFLTGPSQ